MTDPRAASAGSEQRPPDPSTTPPDRPEPPAERSAEPSPQALPGAPEGSGGDMVVVDDYSDQQPWRDWVTEELGRGRPPEDLVAALVAEGWTEEDAQEFVELVRWETRHQRVVTREQVARTARGNGRLSFMTGFVGLASLLRLAESLVRLSRLGPRRGQSGPQPMEAMEATEADQPASSPPDREGRERSEDRAGPVT